MDTDPQQDPSEVAGNRLAAPRSSSRRRLLQAGLGASPALLSIVSTPVRADISVALCRSASAFASVAAAAGGAVASANARQQCYGFGPNYWGGGQSSWPIAKTTLLSVYYGDGAYTWRGNASPTFTDVLCAAPPYGDNGREDLVRNFAAAMLNFLSKATPDTVANQYQLFGMFRYALIGAYRPTTTAAPWTTAQVNTWLAQTFAS